MILYHGSYMEIIKPDLAFSRLRTDFGKGFYLTPLKDQAVNWAYRYKEGRGAAIVTSYKFLEGHSEKMPLGIKILEFDSHTINWLNYITSCRLGLSPESDYDLVIGGVANDKVYDTLQLYFDGLIGADDAIGRLRYNKPNYQYCFKSQNLIYGYLHYIGHEVLK